MEYYDPLALKDIIRMIGPILRIDAHTTFEIRGKYAHFCVQLDLDKPLLRKLHLGSFKQIIQCEGLNLSCHSCEKLKQN